MNDIAELNELMAELLEGNIDDDTMTLTERGREIVNGISDYAEKTQIYQDNKERGEIFKESSAKQIWGYMLDRIVNAPTLFHLTSSVLLIMPFLREKLDGKDNG